MDTVSYLREDMRWTHEWLEATMQDVTQEQLASHIGGMGTKQRTENESHSFLTHA